MNSKVYFPKCTFEKLKLKLFSFSAEAFLILNLSFSAILSWSFSHSQPNFSNSQLKLFLFSAEAPPWVEPRASLFHTLSPQSSLQIANMDFNLVLSNSSKSNSIKAYRISPLYSYLILNKFCNFCTKANFQLSNMRSLFHIVSLWGFEFNLFHKNVKLWSVLLLKGVRGNSHTHKYPHKVIKIC